MSSFEFYGPPPPDDPPEFYRRYPDTYRQYPDTKPTPKDYYETGIADERARIVAWLREIVGRERDYLPLTAEILSQLTDAIERGEHAKEGEA